jgi:hypothetical protein
MAENKGKGGRVRSKYLYFWGEGKIWIEKGFVRNICPWVNEKYKSGDYHFGTWRQLSVSQ